ncbi:MAG: DUF2330 domain-containing protein [Alphaproteobacteria bacterium]|nr:DUF2330 domain-containing protein [Alphaproteobacteria bacterium]
MLPLLLALSATPTAEAFCGFYVSGADASLYNDATLVVLMRDGTTTALSMQNSYQGPPEDFALVVPVPVVLKEDNVKTLPAEVFQHIDQLASPRLVEYWEQDPCYQPIYEMEAASASGLGGPPRKRPSASATKKDYGVTIEAEFEVAEYDIVILSAKDSGGLEAWLQDNQYNIPDGASGVLRPYVEGGTKFFVAKVDTEKVRFEDGRAVLSPLRVHYDAAQFSLPVRLGLLNAKGEQDLLVHVLARGQRYEVANYENAFIPTNIRVLEGVRGGFGDFYDSLYRRTVAEEPRTVVTEYSWDASTCDPCPSPALRANELAALGADIMGDPNPRGWVLTRMHYRYTADSLGEDLVFRAAPPMVGGRGTPNQAGELTEQQPASASQNSFQGRYVILNPWEGEITCENPVRGRWGGPPSGPRPEVLPAPSAMQRGGAARKVALGQLVDQDIPWIGVTKGQDVEIPEAAPLPPEPPSKPAPLQPASEEAAPPALEDEAEIEERGCATAPAAASLGVLALLGLALARRRAV